MEEIVDFDEWLRNYLPLEPKYYAVYDITTGEVTGIYPEQSSVNLENKLEVTREFAESIFDGKASLGAFYVDLSLEKLEIVQIHSLRKIDDILHRIIDKKYSDIVESDIKIRYSTDTGKINFELNENLRNKKIKWNGETSLKFIISSYNDPHKIYQLIQFTLNEVYEKDLEFDYEGEDTNFSVFTIRLFKHYIFERYENN